MVSHKFTPPQTKTNILRHIKEIQRKDHVKGTAVENRTKNVKKNVIKSDKKTGTQLLKNRKEIQGKIPKNDAVVTPGTPKAASFTLYGIKSPYNRKSTPLSSIVTSTKKKKSDCAISHNDGTSSENVLCSQMSTPGVAASKLLKNFRQQMEMLGDQSEEDEAIEYPQEVSQPVIRSSLDKQCHIPQPAEGVPIISNKHDDAVTSPEIPVLSAKRVVKQNFTNKYSGKIERFQQIESAGGDVYQMNLSPRRKNFKPMSRKHQLEEKVLEIIAKMHAEFCGFKQRYQQLIGEKATSKSCSQAQTVLKKKVPSFPKRQPLKVPPPTSSSRDVSVASCQAKRSIAKNSTIHSTASKQNELSCDSPPFEIEEPMEE